LISFAKRIESKHGAVVHRLAIFAFALSVCLGQDTATFRAGVTLVHIDAAVISRDGRILTGFQRNDFRVLDNREQQPLTGFAAEQEGLDLVILFDISGSMRAKVQGVAAAAGQALQELREGDRVSVMVFNNRTRVIAPFTADMAAVERAIRNDVLGSRFGGGTLLQNAVDDAAKSLIQERRSSRHRAVLVITDDFGSRTKRESTIVRDYWEADALLTGLILKSSAAQTLQNVGLLPFPRKWIMQAGVKGIAEKTGGDFIHAGEPDGGF
jgi:VWFA-related protein